MNFLILAVTLWYISRENQALREVNVKIPPAVVFGSTITLMCIFDLEGDKLYSVKWYHGASEFYRYTPSDVNPIKQFKIKGFHVLEHNSNATQVALKHATRDISGQFSCEVTADQPSFYTIMKTADLEVVELPIGNPYISGLKKRYRLGDVIKANCTSEISYPGVNITWYVNGRSIEGPQVHNYRRELQENYVTSVAALRMKITENFSEGEQVKVRCAASMYHLYHRSEERIINIDRRHHHRNMKPTTSTTEYYIPDQWQIQDNNDIDHTLVFRPAGSTAAPNFSYNWMISLVTILLINKTCIR